MDSDVMSLRFGGAELSFAENPPAVVLPDYPSVAGDRQSAAMELDRSAAMGEIHWYSEGSFLQICVYARRI